MREFKVDGLGEGQQVIVAGWSSLTMVFMAMDLYVTFSKSKT